jgi:hypothetical protein
MTYVIFDNSSRTLKPEDYSYESPDELDGIELYSSSDEYEY